MDLETVSVSRDGDEWLVSDGVNELRFPDTEEGHGDVELAVSTLTGGQV